MLDKNIKERTIEILKIAYSINISKKAGEPRERIMGMVGSISKKCEDSTVEELFDLLRTAVNYLVLVVEASHRENDGLREKIKKLKDKIKKLEGGN